MDDRIRQTLCGSFRCSNCDSKVNWLLDVVTSTTEEDPPQALDPEIDEGCSVELSIECHHCKEVNVTKTKIYL